VLPGSSYLARPYAIFEPVGGLVAHRNGLQDPVPFPRLRPKSPNRHNAALLISGSLPVWVKQEVRKRQAAYQAISGERWPGLGSDLDGFRLALECTRPLLLPSGFGFAHLSYMGWQYCPFNDTASEQRWPPCGLTDCDFLIANPRRREWIVFSGLLPHLIAAHHFFEGRGVAYRLAPELTVRVLELGSAESDLGYPAAPVGSVSHQAG